MFYHLMGKKRILRQQQKARKLRYPKKTQLDKDFATISINWQQVSNMPGYKKSILETQSSTHLQKTVYKL